MLPVRCTGGLALSAVAAFLLLVSPAWAVELPPRFQERVIFGDLTTPTAVSLSPDGRVFVAEKSGIIKVYPSLDVPTASVLADLRTNVHNFWDRGLLSIALHPDFPRVPYLYALYTLDAEPGGVPPRWGVAGMSSDGCPTPPGASTHGCVVGGRLSRLTIEGNTATEEVPLVEGWCQQFPSHSIGDIAFGADGSMYISGGEGAGFLGAFDYGQYGIPLNPCDDPPAGIGGVMTPPDAAGGALRSQSPRRAAGQRADFGGTVLRVDALNGLPMADNPLIGTRPNADRIVAYGMRNPFRMAVRPGTHEIYVGDVGSSFFEEINRIADGRDAVVENFGWPCYEGPQRNPAAENAGLSLCQSLYAAPQMTAPVFAYAHNVPVLDGEACSPLNGSSVTGLRFYDGSSFPAPYRGALFLADQSRRCIWTAPADSSGRPRFDQLRVFASGAASAVDLDVAANGDLIYVDFHGGTLRGIRYYPGNQPPTARIVASATSGPVPLSVRLDASSSTDPDEGDWLQFAWDLNGDGGFDDGSGATAQLVLTTAGDRWVSLRVTDRHGETSTAQLRISASNTAPVAQILQPTQALRWRVGQVIFFSGIGSDAEEGYLAAHRMSWSIRLHHCEAECHVHPLLSYVGISSGLFYAPDHDYPAYLEIVLTVTDSGGLKHSASLLLNPLTAELTLQSQPEGILLTSGNTTQSAPLTRRTIVGSRLSISAPSPQGMGAESWRFSRWSNGGGRQQEYVMPSTDSVLTAFFERGPACDPGLSRCGKTAGGQVRTSGSSRSVPMKGVKVAVRGAETVLVQTDAAGLYRSPESNCRPCEVLPLGGPPADTNALSALDAVMALQAAVGLRQLDPLTRLACDASGDGQVTAIDAAYILQRRVGLIGRLPAAQRCGGEWLFVPESRAAPGRAYLPQMTPQYCSPGMVELSDLDGSPGDVDFRAVQIGDCDGSGSR
jgi:glucose/arabinose dehydrogenase/PKD repeat protein